MDPFDTQFPLLDAMGSPGQPYEEPEMDVDAEREKLRRRLAMQLMQDQLNAAGPKAHAAAMRRMPSPVFGQHGPAVGQEGDGLTPPIDRSIVADAMRRQALGDSLTLNPGMKRFLGNDGGGVAAEPQPPRPSLDENLGRLRGGAYQEGTLPSGTQVSHMPDGSIALRGQGFEGIDKPGIQLADMTPEQRVQQEFDRKVMADASRQKQAEIAKKEALRKGTAQAKINQRLGIGASAPLSGGGSSPALEQAYGLLDRYGAAALPIVGKLMEGMSQQEIAKLQAEAAASLSKSKMEHERGMQTDRFGHETTLEGQKQANSRQAQEDRFGHERTMSQAEIAAADRRHQDTLGIERQKIEAQNDPKRQALGASINSDGAISPEAAEDFLTGKGGDPTRPKLTIPAVPADDSKVRAALSTIRNSGPDAYDEPHEQEALRQSLLSQGITTDDLRRFQGGDYGDPSWYEWWDRGIAPFLSSGSAALIDERHANTPLLQALIGAR